MSRWDGEILVSIPVPVRPEAAFVACFSCGGSTSFGVFVRADLGNGNCDAGSGGGVLNECRRSGGGSGVSASASREGDLFLSWSGSRDGEVMTWARVRGGDGDGWFGRWEGNWEVVCSCPCCFCPGLRGPGITEW